MRVVVYISGHGFGHASRDVQIINAIAQREPDARFTVRTSVPQWFLEDTLVPDVDFVDGDVDSGMVQPDSLTINETETAIRAARFYGNFAEKVDQEVDFLKSCNASIVLGDIPPLAFAAAGGAGLRSVAVGNFTWDWIYQAYAQFDQYAPGVRYLISDAYAQASLGLRLPFAGGFATIHRVENAPLVARSASVPRTEARARLNLESGRPIVLASFGGHGGTLPLEHVAADGLFTLVATDHEIAPDATSPHLRVINRDDLRKLDLSYTDLVGAADVVASKLGYGIVSECISNQVSLLYTLRGRFIEQDLFIRDAPAVLRCRHIERPQLRAGRWADAVIALLNQPPPVQSMNAKGADVVAERVLAVAGQA